MTTEVDPNNPNYHITYQPQTHLIFKKMSQVMADIKPVAKNSTNSAQKYQFRGIDDFVNALYPALVKHGVFLCPKVVEESHEIREVTRSSGHSGIDKHVHLKVEYTFYAEDGSSVEVGPIASEGIDSGDKATNKALSAALKYALMQTFSIPTEDLVDADSESPNITQPARPAITPSPLKNYAPQTATQAQQQSKPRAPGRKVSEAQIKRMYSIGRERGFSSPHVQQVVHALAECAEADMDMVTYDTVVGWMQNYSVNEIKELMHLAEPPPPLNEPYVPGGEQVPFAPFDPDQEVPF